MKEAKMNIDPTLPCAQEMTKKDFPLLQKYILSDIAVTMKRCTMLTFDRTDVFYHVFSRQTKHLLPIFLVFFIASSSI